MSCSTPVIRKRVLSIWSEGDARQCAATAWLCTMGRVMGEFTSAKKQNIDTIRLGIDQKICLVRSIETVEVQSEEKYICRTRL